MQRPKCLSSHQAERSHSKISFKLETMTRKVREKLLIMAKHVCEMGTEQLLALQCDCAKVLQKCRNQSSSLTDISGSVN